MRLLPVALLTATVAWMALGGIPTTAAGHLFEPWVSGPLVPTLAMATASLWPLSLLLVAWSRGGGTWVGELLLFGGIGWGGVLTGFAFANGAGPPALAVWLGTAVVAHALWTELRPFRLFRPKPDRVVAGLVTALPWLVLGPLVPLSLHRHAGCCGGDLTAALAVVSVLLIPLWWAAIGLVAKGTPNPRHPAG